MAAARLEPDAWAWWRPEDGFFGGDDAGSLFIDTNNDAPLELLASSPGAWWGEGAEPRLGPERQFVGRGGAEAERVSCGCDGCGCADPEEGDGQLDEETETSEEDGDEDEQQQETIAAWQEQEEAALSGPTPAARRLKRPPAAVATAGPEAKRRSFEDVLFGKLEKDGDGGGPSQQEFMQWWFKQKRSARSASEEKDVDGLDLPEPPPEPERVPESGARAQ